jgi:hypothetical protein
MTADELLEQREDELLAALSEIIVTYVARTLEPMRQRLDTLESEMAAIKAAQKEFKDDTD